MLYFYKKAPITLIKYSSASRPPTRNWTAVFSLVSFLLGLFLIFQVAYPTVGWYLFVLPTFPKGIASPLGSNFKVPVQAQESALTPSSADTYHLSAWLPSPFPSQWGTLVRFYTLSVPKLKIDSATVEAGGEDLKKSLIAWPTAAPPGTYGNNIIFGHSELPQFANPKDYSGIFTHLLDLEKGDPIFVDYDGVRYKYVVADKKVIDPTDLSILEQRFDRIYLTLITCVPPGTLWKRGVVTAILTQI